MADLAAGAGRTTLEAAGQVAKPASRLLSNSIAMGAANIAGRGLGYACIILMARRLDVRYLGIYAVLLTSSMLLELLSNLGLDKILIREIAGSAAGIGQGYFWAALPVRLSTAAVSTSVAWAMLVLVFKTQLQVSPLSVALFLSAIFPIVAARNCEAFLTAHERLVPIAVSQLVERLVTLSAVLMLAFGLLRFNEMLWFVPIASLSRLLVVGRSANQIWIPNVETNHPNILRLVRQGLELFSVEILALVYFRSDTLMVAKLDGLSAAGVYQVTYKVFDLCLSLFSGFLQASFPRMIRSNTRESLQSMLIIGSCLLIIPCGLIIICRHFILNTLRADYASGSTSLLWLMLTVPLVYITSTLANAAIVEGRIRLLIGFAALLIFTNVALNLILIPKWSINGAAFSTFACELISAALLGPFAWRSISKTRGSL